MTPVRTCHLHISKLEECWHWWQHYCAFVHLCELHNFDLSPVIIWTENRHATYWCPGELLHQFWCFCHILRFCKLWAHIELRVSRDIAWLFVPSIVFFPDTHNTVYLLVAGIACQCYTYWLSPSAFWLKKTGQKVAFFWETLQISNGVLTDGCRVQISNRGDNGCSKF